MNSEAINALSAEMLDCDLVNRVYPDDPCSWNKSFIDKLFAELIFDAATRKDILALVCHTIQHGAALAYIGYSDEAKTRISSLLNQPWAVNFQPLIEQALISPTYQPDGQPIYL